MQLTTTDYQAITSSYAIKIIADCGQNPYITGMSLQGDSAAMAAELSGDVPPKRIRTLRRPARLDKRLGIWKRICELKALYESALGDRERTPLLMARVQEAAMKMATAEVARARFLKGESIRIDAVATCERIARDAVRALKLVDSPTAKTPSLAEYLAQKAAAE